MFTILCEKINFYALPRDFWVNLLKWLLDLSDSEAVNLFIYHYATFSMTQQTILHSGKFAFVFETQSLFQ